MLSGCIEIHSLLTLNTSEIAFISEFKTVSQNCNQVTFNKNKFKEIIAPLKNI